MTEEKRPKSRGLDEVAHFFFSSKAEPPHGVSPPVPAKPERSSPRVLTLASLVPGLPGSFLTANLAVELAARQKKVLVADMAPDSFNIFFAMGMARRFTPIERFLTGESREIEVSGPLGIRLLALQLEAGRVGLLKMCRPGSLFRSLVRAEQKSEVMLINMQKVVPFSPRQRGDPAGRMDSLSPSAHETAPYILVAASEVLLLVPAAIEGLKACYGFVKSCFVRHLRIPIGVLLLRIYPEPDPERVFGVLSGAALKFLGKELRSYGHLIQNRQLYSSLLQGKPLSRGDPGDPNSAVLSGLAGKIARESGGEVPIPERIRTSFPRGDRQLLLETLSESSEGVPEAFSVSSLNRDEEGFLDRQWESLSPPQGISDGQA